MNRLGPFLRRWGRQEGPVTSSPSGPPWCHGGSVLPRYKA